MRHFTYIISLLLLMLCSCSDDILPETPVTNDVPDGTPIKITMSAEFPELNLSPGTRMSDQPQFDQLNINILVFDEAGIMQQFIPHTDISDIKVNPDNPKEVIFDVKNIYSSSQPRRLHFVVTSVPDILQIPGGELITAMANETTVMPALMTEGDTDTYWGVGVIDKINADSKFSIKVVRNFVKIDVTNNVTEDFTMLGYTVVNRPNKGTVAPYISQSKTFADFLNPGPTDTDGLTSYDGIIGQGYHGINPAGQEESMTHTEDDLVALEASIGSNPVYMYERSQSAIETVGADAKVTYLIVKGEYLGTTYYYKLDLGYNEGGRFKFYDLLRNFQYSIQINEVSGAGATTLEAAMNGMPYNNISASVQMHDLFSISYTGEMITVSDTEVIFTEQTNDFELRFRYYLPVPDPNDPSKTINGTKEEFLKVYDLSKPNEPEYEFNVAGVFDKETGKITEKTVNLSGDVIESAKITKGDGDWYILKITTKGIPENGRLEQNLRIYYSEQPENGEELANLGRSITLMLRQPWELTYEGLSQTTKDADGNEITNSITHVRSGAGQEFIVDFMLPTGLSNSQFPLTLTFESDKQNIYAKKGTALHVVTGKSGFIGATTDNIIRYEYVISRGDYDPTKVYHATFLTNATATEDTNYSTAGMDTKTNGNLNGNHRANNNGTETFCIRIANKGQKCIEPYYVNITRE